MGEGYYYVKKKEFVNLRRQMIQWFSPWTFFNKREKKLSYSCWNQHCYSLELDGVMSFTLIVGSDVSLSETDTPVLHGSKVSCRTLVVLHWNRTISPSLLSSFLPKSFFIVTQIILFISNNIHNTHFMKKLSWNL